MRPAPRNRFTREMNDGIQALEQLRRLESGQRIVGFDGHARAETCARRIAHERRDFIAAATQRFDDRTADETGRTRDRYFLQVFASRAANCRPRSGRHEAAARPGVQELCDLAP